MGVASFVLSAFSGLVFAGYLLVLTAATRWPELQLFPSHDGAAYFLGGFLLTLAVLLAELLALGLGAAGVAQRGDSFDGVEASQLEGVARHRCQRRRRHAEGGGEHHRQAHAKGRGAAHPRHLPEEYPHVPCSFHSARARGGIPVKARDHDTTIPKMLDHYERRRNFRECYLAEGRTVYRVVSGTHLPTRRYAEQVDPLQRTGRESL